MLNRSAAVELNFPQNDEHTWYDIKGFPQYQLSIPDYFLRSFKNFNNFPYGRLKKEDKDGYYTITDCNNFARKVKIRDLVPLLQLDDPHGTFAPFMGPMRNSRVFIDESQLEGIGEIVRKPARINKKAMTRIVNFDSLIIKDSK